MSTAALLAKTWVRTYDVVNDALSSRVCYGLYDGDRLDGPSTRRRRRARALLHPADERRQRRAAAPRSRRSSSRSCATTASRCEVLNYNLPCINPRDPFDHLIRAIKALGVPDPRRVDLQPGHPQHARRPAARARGLPGRDASSSAARIRPSPISASWASSFIDYVCRGEAEESFPALVEDAARGPGAGA